MGKNKLQRYSEVSQLPNVYEYTDFEGTEIRKPKGNWRQEIFKNDNPVVLELACGKGEYSVSLAEKYPDKNFVGIDIKGARIWKGAKRADHEGIRNVRFLRIFIDHLADYFEPGEVNEIWITFPDPFLKKKKQRKRLTSSKFLDIYKNVLCPDGIMHLKTDSDPLFQFTFETLSREEHKILDRVEDIYLERPEDDLLTIKTYYEKRHLKEGKTIKYVRFQLRS